MCRPGEPFNPEQCPLLSGMTPRERARRMAQMGCLTTCPVATDARATSTANSAEQVTAAPSEGAIQAVRGPAKQTKSRPRLAVGKNERRRRAPADL